MLDFCLPLFPFEATAITVTTTVWIGVLVSVFFNLRLGWTLSGLVVPGYLVPLMITRPITAGVILAEAAVTYFIVVMLSEGPRRTAYWSSMFGRDRFFVILLVSVVVRAVLDGYVLPWAGQIAVDDYGINFDYRNNLHSFGLIVVALIANYFWKPGIMRGLPPLVTCVGVTFVAIEYVLVPYTNFNLGNFHLIYDDLTTSLMASPKAYIIVLTTAYVASWMNLRYAWDFNGILIPALLGLLWHDPAKILISGAECVLICFAGSYLMRRSVFRKMTIQGSRKILFFFTICFGYRLLACHFFAWFFPTFNPTDAFGFGYLLSTLMAIKITDKQKAIGMLFGTAKVSMLGAVLGSLIGFAFFCGPKLSLSLETPVVAATIPSQAVAIDVVDQPLHAVIRAKKTLLYEKRKSDSYRAPDRKSMLTFNIAMKQIAKLGPAPGKESLDGIARSLGEINYRVSLVDDRYLLLCENSPAHGWGMFVVDTSASDGIDLQVPSPLGEWSTLESGVSLFQQFRCRTLAIAGSSRGVNFNGEADVVNHRATIFNIFAQVFQGNGTVQVRGYTRSIGRQLCKAEQVQSKDAAEHLLSADSRVYVRGTIPKRLPLTKLKSLSGKLDVRWNASPTVNGLRDWTPGNHIELILNRADRRRLVAQLGSIANQTKSASSGFKRVNQSLNDWLLNIKDHMVQQGTDAYVRAKVEEMLFMDQEVFTPLIAILSQLPPESASTSLPLQTTNTEGHQEHNMVAWLTEDIQHELASINDAAATQNYQISVIIDEENESSYVAVAEQTDGVPPSGAIHGSPVKGWGTFIFRPGLADSFAVEVPRPLFERRSFEFGVNLFQRPSAAAILIAGAHPRANLDGTSDISKAANRVNLFNLVRHVLLRQLGDRPLLIAQARAIQAPVRADIVIATDDGARSVAQLSPLKDRLVRQLTDDQLSTLFVDGGKETAGYELGILMQAASVQVSQNKEVISLWLSPALRSKFREQTENLAMAAQFQACGIVSVEQKLVNYLHTLGFSLGDDLRGDALPKSLRHELIRYCQTSDIVRLAKIVNEYPQWRFVRVIDGPSGQAFLTIRKDDMKFPTLLNLSGAFDSRTMIIKTFHRSTVQSFVKSRTRWMTSESSDPTALANQIVLDVDGEVDRPHGGVQ